MSLKKNGKEDAYSINAHIVLVFLWGNDVPILMFHSYIKKKLAEIFKMYSYGGLYLFIYLLKCITITSSCNMMRFAGSEQVNLPWKILLQNMK